MAGMGLPPGCGALRGRGRKRPSTACGRLGHFRPLLTASPGDRGADHLESRASPVAFDASWWASLGAAGPGGRTGPLPRRCSQCRPPGRARRPPLPDAAERSSAGHRRSGTTSIRTQAGRLLLQHGANERVGRLLRSVTPTWSRSSAQARPRRATGISLPSSSTGTHWMSSSRDSERCVTGRRSTCWTRSSLFIPIRKGGA